jgi:SH3 domain of SH3b2 type
MSANTLRKYIDIILEAEMANRSIDFTRPALQSSIASKVVGGDPTGYDRFKLYIQPLFDTRGFKQIDIRVTGQGPRVQPVDDSIAIFDASGQFYFAGDPGANQRLISSSLAKENPSRFSSPEKETVKDAVFKVMHPATTKGAAGAYQQTATYHESK